MSRISEASSTEDLCGKWHPFVMRIENFMTMDDAKADELAQRVMALDEPRTALRKKYHEAMKKVLPTVSVVRFLQLDNQDAD